MTGRENFEISTLVVAEVDKKRLIKKKRKKSSSAPKLTSLTKFPQPKFHNPKS